MESKTTTAVVAVVIGLLVGGGAGYAVSTANQDDHKESMSMEQSTSESNPNSATKAADLRSTLVTLGVEHMDLTYGAVSSTLQGAKSAEADTADLVKNGEDLAAAVGSIYGEDAEKTFDSVWKLHLNQFVAYATGASKNDDAAKKAALDKIDAEYTKPLAAYLAKANPNLPEDVLYKSLNQHVDMTAVMIDAQAAGDYESATAQRDKAVDHMEMLFSTLADGIVKQFPKKF
jgi:hypothetical protein